ncbi:response regulator [Sphingomicrobium astaxanthinifaciens]|uniref:response regulator n=1 Tax=Sphingomicrobium astaxanthinifaciens TaxID=1227949 RepID=UPI001FCC777D|nr:response regulator [Sphingomicrobium astaxanthinifaciens]MCJ7420587.1 response regulator [Sphingomicrobium astaxanthinifaciens]
MSDDKVSNGARILLVEDSPVVSLNTEDALRDHGYFVVGPAYDMAAALDLSNREQIDAAIVDLNIRGEKCFQVLEILEKRDVPFILTSGYADWTMPEQWIERPRLQKPFEQEALLKKLEKMIRQKAG